MFNWLLWLRLNNAKLWYNFPEKIISKYLIYVKEINDYITSILIKKEKENEEIKEKEYYYFIIKSYIYFFGFKDIEEQNLSKASEYLDKGRNLTNKLFLKKIYGFIKYRISELMYNNKDISYEELIERKKNLIEYYYKNLNLKYKLLDCYIIGDDFFKGITQKNMNLLAF